MPVERALLLKLLLGTAIAQMQSLLQEGMAVETTKPEIVDVPVMTRARTKKQREEEEDVRVGEAVGGEVYRSEGATRHRRRGRVRDTEEKATDSEEALPYLI